MIDVEAGEILDLAYSGMSGPAMARRWNSADLQNITPDIIGKILNDEAAMAAVKKIQGFANPLRRQTPTRRWGELPRRIACWGRRKTTRRVAFEIQGHSSYPH